MIFWNNSGAHAIPNINRVYRKRPLRVMKVVIGLDFSEISTYLVRKWQIFTYDSIINTDATYVFLFLLFFSPDEMHFSHRV